MWTLNVREILTNPKVRLGACSVLSAAAGSAVTYATLSKRLDAKYSAIADKEIADAKVFYKAMDKPDEPPVSIEDVVEAAEQLATYGGHILQPLEDLPPGQPEEWIAAAKEEALSKEPLVERNIFTDPLPNVPDHMVKERGPEKPYVINETEYFDNAPEHIQDSYTYYEGDNVLADRNDQEIRDPERTEIVGEDGLDRWGYGSNDVHMVYIRNEKRGLDVEIQRSTGKYSEEVAGFTDEDETELKHSADYHRRKAFRRGEE